MKKILSDLSREEMGALVLSMGEKRFRADQIFEGLMQGKSVSCLPLPAALKERILQEYEDTAVKIEEVFCDEKDGTKKFLFRLADGNLIEGVLMKYRYGNTQCVSTQVGCRMGCKFCASTLNGLKRNLSAGEILGQIAVVNRAMGGTHEMRAVTNVVLMGSGEPFDNYANVIKFLRLLSEPKGLCISARNVSLSTCGLVPEMEKFREEGIPLTLTVSLHATSDGERARTMPIAGRYKIADILKACENYFERTGRRYIFEYCLISGENSDLAHAKALIALLKGKPCHVNLIRLNEVKERSLQAACEREAQAFLKALRRGGISATLRRSMGSEIGGACGQLRAKVLNGEHSNVT